jgi:hypothetical protein
VGINAGLYIAGRTPMLLIQNKGVYACVNALRGIALEASVPTLMLVGQHTRDVTKPAAEGPVFVRLDIARDEATPRFPSSRIAEQVASLRAELATSDKVPPR